MPVFIVNLNYPTQLFWARSKRLNHPDHPVSVARVGSLDSIIMFLESQTAIFYIAFPFIDACFA